MTKKVALYSITVVRDNKAVTVAPNETFDFTREELADFERMEKEHNEGQKNASVKLPFRAIVRDPKDETVDDGAATKKVNKVFNQKKGASSEL